MKHRPLMYFLGFVAALGLSLSGIQSAHATACSDLSSNLLGKVDGAVQCEFGGPVSPSNPANEESFLESNTFFGIGTWTYAGKTNIAGSTEEGDESPDINFSSSPTNSGQSGTWTIDKAAFTNWDNVVLLFKSGQNPLVAYLLDSTIGTGSVADVACGANTCSGGWETPFTHPPFDLPGGATQQGVSHITASVNGLNNDGEPGPGPGPGGGTVPTPATVLLLGIGLLGMVQVRRWMA